MAAGVSSVAVGLGVTPPGVPLAAWPIEAAGLGSVEGSGEAPGRRVVTAARAPTATTIAMTMPASSTRRRSAMPASVRADGDEAVRRPSWVASCRPEPSSRPATARSSSRRGGPSWPRSRPDGRPRLVPVCFVVDPGQPVVYTPLDDKPKRVDDVRDLARVRDILERPAVTLLVDRWDEDWSRLAWLRLGGAATLIEPGPDREGERAAAIAALRAKYPQYASHRLEANPLIRIEIEDVARWGVDDG